MLRIGAAMASPVIKLNPLVYTKLKRLLILKHLMWGKMKFVLLNMEHLSDA